MDRASLAVLLVVSGICVSGVIVCSACLWFVLPGGHAVVAELTNRKTTMTVRIIFPF
jgi:hypothetical protein